MPIRKGESIEREDGGDKIKYPQDEKELYLLFAQVWKIVNEKKEGEKEDIHSEIIKAIKNVMEETIEAFHQGNKEIVLTNLEVFYTIIEEDEVEKSKKEEVVLELDWPKEKKTNEIKKRISILRNKIRPKDKVNILLDDLEKELLETIEKNDTEREKRSWLTLYSLEQSDLGELENLLTDIEKILDRDEGEEWKYQ